MNKNYHIIFEENYLKNENFGQRDSSHLTWSFKPLNNFDFKFGGKLQNGLNRLISFDNFFGEDIGLNNKSFAINFEDFFNAQLNQKNLYYHHLDNDIIKPLHKINIENRYSNYPLKETKIKIALTPKEFLNQDWEGNLNRIGENPIWVQTPESLHCPLCEREMSFIFQLDSGLPDLNQKNNYEIMFGNDGVCYAFWCIKDKISGYLWQST